MNERIEARGLEKRYSGKSKGRVTIEIRVRIEMRIEVRARMRAKVRIDMKWVPSIYLVKINK
jgi:hypothetical protein